MEHGFFHPDRGYWQTIDTPSEEILGTYPQGTLSVPLRPAENFTWDGTQWIETLGVVDRSSMKLTFAQLLIGLVAQGWLSESDGELWLSGTLPQPIGLLIETFPAEHRFAAKARALRPSEVVRLDPLVEALAVANGKSAEEIDQFFEVYTTV